MTKGKGVILLVMVLGSATLGIAAVVMGIRRFVKLNPREEVAKQHAHVSETN